ncbi:MAG: ABC transporter ATP-binding protein [Lachnospiraceae bacterium]|nr:ABC transporter ATP-binding protein [Lachnospiraceae bacterium]
MSEYALEVRALKKTFGSKVAVGGVSLTVEKGILFSLLGVNGAGKTTMIRMLNGLSKPTEGQAFVMGHSVAQELSQIKQLSNISPQETAVAPNLSVWENLEFMADIYGMNREKSRKRVQEVLDQFALHEVEQQRAGTLSGGWQRRLSIAMALITNPEILYLDEPTLGLDVLARKELWRTIEDLKGKITIVLTTHYMEEAERLSDQVAVMVAGEIKACGTVHELYTITGKKTLEDAFVAIAEGEVSI